MGPNKNIPPVGIVNEEEDGAKHRFSLRNLNRKQVILVSVAVLAVGAAIAWAIIRNNQPEPESLPGPTNITATISPEEMKRFEEEVNSQGTVAAVGDSTLSIDQNEGGRLDLQLTDQTAFATGKGGMDGSKADLKPGQKVIFTYNKNSGVLIYIAFTPEGQGN